MLLMGMAMGIPIRWYKKLGGVRNGNKVSGLYVTDRIDWKLVHLATDEEAQRVSL